MGLKVFHGWASSRVIGRLLLCRSLLDNQNQPEYTSGYFWVGLANGPSDAAV
jgi:hypothetical protein